VSKPAEYEMLSKPAENEMVSKPTEYGSKPDDEQILGR